MVKKHKAALKLVRKERACNDTPSNPLKLKDQNCFRCGAPLLDKGPKPEELSGSDTFWVYAFCDIDCAREHIRYRAENDEKDIQRVYANLENKCIP